MREVVEQFFTYYLVERDVDKTLSMVSEQVYSLGTGRQEVATNKKELEILLRREKKGESQPISFKISEYHETYVGDVAFHCYCKLLTERLDDKGITVRLETRFTGLFVREGEKWLVQNLHVSTPTNVQEGTESFPVKYSEEERNRLTSKAEKNVVRLMAEMIPGGIMEGYLEPGFPIYVINEELLGYMGFTYEELIEETGGLMINTMHPDDRAMVESLVQEECGCSGEYDVRYRLLRKGGTYFWIHDRGRKITTEEGRDAIISVMMDISKSVELEEKLRREASQDPLTHINNRRETFRRIKHSFSVDIIGTLLVMDIDNFKNINDEYGHQMGDEVLTFLSNVLIKNQSKAEIVGRLGGDEFVVYMRGITSTAEIEKKCSNIQEDFHKMVKDQFKDFDISVSIGAAVRKPCEDLTSLYKRADQALYFVKGVEKGTIKISDK